MEIKNFLFAVLSIVFIAWISFLTRRVFMHLFCIRVAIQEKDSIYLDSLNEKFDNIFRIEPEFCPVEFSKSSMEIRFRKNAINNRNIQLINEEINSLRWPTNLPWRYIKIYNYKDEIIHKIIKPEYGKVQF